METSGKRNNAMREVECSSNDQKLEQEMSNLAIGEKYPLVDHKLKEQEERHCEENGKQFAELASQLEMKNSEISQLKKKGQSVAKYNTELKSKFENLKQEINDLRSENKMLHQENKELRIGRDRPKQLEPDNVDGRPSEILPFISRSLKSHHLAFGEPFNCPSSCVLGAFFVLLIIVKQKRFCLVRFIKEIENRLQKKLKRFENTEDEEVEKLVLELAEGNCSSSLKVLHFIDIINAKKNPFHSAEFEKGVNNLHVALDTALKKMRVEKVYCALIVVNYEWEGRGRKHCMTVKLNRRDANKPTDVYDAQRGDLWPKFDKHIECINQFSIYTIAENVATEFLETCGWKVCSEEREAAISASKASGTPESFFHMLDLWLSSSYINEQLEDIGEDTEEKTFL